MSINGGDTLKFDQPYWITIKVGSDPEMTPREKLAPVSFAFRSIYADTADYAESSTGVSAQDFHLGPEGTSSRIKGLVSSCSDLPSSGSLTWTLITNHAGVPYDFCISSAFTRGDPWYAAEVACEDLGGRLCTRSEYRSFYAQTGTSVDGYWTAGLEDVNPDSCKIRTCYNSTYDFSFNEVVQTRCSYRCCVPLR